MINGIPVSNIFKRAVLNIAAIALVASVFAMKAGTIDKEPEPAKWAEADSIG